MVSFFENVLLSGGGKMARVHLYVVLLCVLRLYRDLGAFSPGIILSLDPFKSNFEVYL